MYSLKKKEKNNISNDLIVIDELPIINLNSTGVKWDHL